MYVTYTTNYQLPQWVKSDRIMMDDFNDANSKIDTALKSQADALNSLETNMASLGNCQLYYTTYTGTGTYGSSHPTTLTFPGYPALVVLFSGDSGYMIAARSSNRAVHFFNDTSCIQVIWSENTLSWSHYQSDVHQLNAAGVTYSVVALLDLEK